MKRITWSSNAFYHNIMTASCPAIAFVKNVHHYYYQRAQLSTRITTWPTPNWSRPHYHLTFRSNPAVQWYSAGWCSDVGVSLQGPCVWRVGNPYWSVCRKEEVQCYATSMLDLLVIVCLCITGLKITENKNKPSDQKWNLTIQRENLCCVPYVTLNHVK